MKIVYYIYDRLDLIRLKIGLISPSQVQLLDCQHVGQVTN